MRYTVLFFLVICFSCKKTSDNINDFKQLTDVYFQAQSVLGNDLGVKYEGHPIAWDGTGNGKIHVPEGEGKFEFYDKRDGKVLGEKTLNISLSDTQRFVIFQPLEDSPLAFLNPEAQNREEAAPEGFMKIRIASYAPDFIPYEKIDVIVIGMYFDEEFNFFYEPVDTIFNISRNLDNEPYHLVSKGGQRMESWSFSFRDHETGQEVKNFGGTLYRSLDIYPSLFDKFVFTVYLVPFEAWGEHESFLKFGEGFYNIEPRILFEN